MKEFVSLDRSLVNALAKETWSDAASFGGLIWTTGQIGWDKKTARLVEGFEAQVDLAMRNLVDVLEKAGSSLQDVLITRNFLTDHDQYPVFDRIYRKYFKDHMPARVTVVVSDHIGHSLFDMEVVAVKSDPGSRKLLDPPFDEIEFIPLERELVDALDGNAAWSDAASIGGLIWTTGQIGWDKKTGLLKDGFEAQASLAMENLSEVLEKAGSSLDNVLITRNYLTDHDQYPIFDELHNRYFKENLPARVTVVVKDHIDHALFDMEVVAIKEPSKFQELDPPYFNKKRFVPLDGDLVKALGGKETWSEAAISRNLVWTTGQIGWDKKTSKLVNGNEAQVDLAIRNLSEVLRRAGSSLDDVLLTRNYFTDNDQYPIFDKVYSQYFSKNIPARVSVVVKDHIDHALYDMEVVAIRSGNGSEGDAEKDL